MPLCQLTFFIHLLTPQISNTHSSPLPLTFYLLMPFLFLCVCSCLCLECSPALHLLNFMIYFFILFMSLFRPSLNTLWGRGHLITNSLFFPQYLVLPEWFYTCCSIFIQIYISNFHFYNLCMHIFNFFWMLDHIIIHNTYPIKSGYLPPKPTFLLFQTI